MRIFIKICGLTSPDAVTAAVDAGADAVGFVLAESPRRVDAKGAARLAALAPPGIIRVAVFSHPSNSALVEALDTFNADWVQTDAEDFAQLQVPAGAGRLPVFRDVAQLDEALMRREPRVLFEAAMSGAAQPVNWDRAATLARSTALMLAGGLNPDNVAEAIARVRPWGVDVSSGVERSRGIKDLGKIRAFVAAVRHAEHTLGIS